MSVFWSAIWGATEKEKRTHSLIHAKLFQELQRIFTDKDLKRKSERKYILEDVKTIFADDLYEINRHFYQEDGYMCCDDDDQPKLRAAVVKWLDDVVVYKAFLDDNPQLAKTVKERILEYAQYDDFRFDWHYWQLFREELPKVEADENESFETENVDEKKN